MFGTAQEQHISNVNDLISLFDQITEMWTSSQVFLENDIDFGTAETPLTNPLGTKADGECEPFVGTFDGNNYTIKGLNMDNTETPANAGLFCGLCNATVQNIVIDSSCSFAGQVVGALSASTYGGTIAVENVHNHAKIMCGKDGCQYLGECGSLIGCVGTVKDTFVVVKHCSNTGNITAPINSDNSWYMGGLIGDTYNQEVLEIEFENCTNNGAVTCQSGYECFIGGFAGIISTDNANVTVRNCINNGAITSQNAIEGYPSGYFRIYYPCND